jgi:predicted nucleotidyltransferase
LEVPTLHRFLKEFPWVLDPRWNMIADEVEYSDMLRNRYGDEVEEPDENKRIDFMCVKESNTLVVVEIKRPHSRISEKQLNQLKEYVYFVRGLVRNATDPSLSRAEVIGYILCGDTVDTYYVNEEVKTLAASHMYVRKYRDLLGMVKSSHREFLQKYESLRNNKEEERARLIAAAGGVA